jgi:hypothetical protein
VVGAGLGVSGLGSAGVSAAVATVVAAAEGTMVAGVLTVVAPSIGPVGEKAGVHVALGAPQAANMRATPRAHPRIRCFPNEIFFIDYYRPFL